MKINRFNQLNEETHPLKVKEVLIRKSGLNTELFEMQDDDNYNRYMFVNNMFSLKNVVRDGKTIDIKDLVMSSRKMFDMIETRFLK